MQTVYVDDTNQAEIICPKCGFEKKINATNFKNTQRRLKDRCKCGETFPFIIDFRKKFRKDVMLSGEYIVQEKAEKGELVIRDLSLSGIRFESFRPHQISTDDTLEVKFKLDKPQRKEIRKVVKVIWVKDLTVGAQFIERKLYDNDLCVLGFYLNF